MRPSFRLLERVRGSLLFETFIALIILSVGITSSLRVFSETLMVGKAIGETDEVKAGADHLLFEWFAHAGGVALPDNGLITLPLETKSDRDYRTEINSQNIDMDAEESEEDEKARLLRKNQFYQIRGHVLSDEERRVFDFDAIVYRRSDVKR